MLATNVISFTFYSVSGLGPHLISSPRLLTLVHLAKPIPIPILASPRPISQVLVPMILLVYATEDLEEAVHHRFMPWWAIVWLPMLVTMTTMAFSPNSFHYMILYVMYENACIFPWPSP